MVAVVEVKMVVLRISRIRYSYMHQSRLQLVSEAKDFQGFHLPKARRGVLSGCRVQRAFGSRFLPSQQRKCARGLGPILVFLGQLASDEWL